MSTNYTNDQENYDCPDCERTFDTYNGLTVHYSASHDGKLGVDVECHGCGKVFTVPPSRKDTAKYCSMECTKVREEIECKQCGTTFEVRPSRSHKKFCGSECVYEYRTGDNHPNSKEWVEVTCANCGDEFELMPHKVENAKRHFCDEDCRAEWVGEWAKGRYTGEDHWMYDIDPEDHPMWNGGAFPYGPGWNPKKKRAVRERDGYECVVCGMSQEEHYEEYDMNLHVHHIKQARTFDNPELRNSMDNLVTLCLACHHKYEGVPIEVQT